MKSLFASLEILEQRIAPAVFTYLSTTGAEVTVTTSKGTDADLAGALTFVNSGVGKILQKVNFAQSTIFRGTNLTIAAAGTLPVADVGTIDARGIDLGSVAVDGDVGYIDVGDSTLSTAAVRSLHVGSLGFRTTTQGEGAKFNSVIMGPLTGLEIDHNLAGTLTVQGTAATKLGSARIHGSLTGGTTAESGSMNISGGIDFLQIDGNMIGGSGQHSGSVQAGGLVRTVDVEGTIKGGRGLQSGVFATTNDITTLQIGGSVQGETLAGATAENGQVLARRITTATIVGALKGGLADFSGAIRTTSIINSITVQDGLIGGVGRESGAVSAGSSIVKAMIGTGLAGGLGDLSGSLLALNIGTADVNGPINGGSGAVSGGISSVGSTDKVLIHGKVTGGQGDNSGSIGSGGFLNTVVIEGGLEGGGGFMSGSVATKVRMGNVTIGVALTGGTGSFSGTVGSLGPVTSVHVVGTVVGSSGDYSGSILSGGTLSSVVIDQSLLGSTGSFSGRIEAGTLSSVKITTNLSGGFGANSGTINASVRMGSIDIGGNLIGIADDGQGQNANGNGAIFSNGPLASVHIGRDVTGGEAPNSGAIIGNSTLGKISIDGSLIGGSAAHSGGIFTQSNAEGSDPVLTTINQVIVGVSIVGGSGSSSGVIESVGNLGSVTVGTDPAGLGGVGEAGGGGLRGGTGQSSSSILAVGTIGNLFVTGSLLGMGDRSASIFSGSSITKLVINQDVSGAGSYSGGSYPGQITAAKSIGSIEIGGTASGTAGDYSGAIAAGSLGSVVIHGSLLGGDGAFSGSVRALSGDLTSLRVDVLISAQGDGEDQYVSARRNIGTVSAGSIVGNGGRVIIMAGGTAFPANAAAALAIKSVISEGPMTNTKIVAGLLGNYNLPILNSIHASIGTVEVGLAGQSVTGIYRGNDIAAGFVPNSGGYGNSDDSQAGNDPASPFATISKVIIHGTLSNDQARHGIVANQVGSVQFKDPAKPAELTTLALTPGRSNDFLAQILASNVYVSEGAE